MRDRTTDAMSEKEYEQDQRAIRVKPKQHNQQGGRAHIHPAWQTRTHARIHINNDNIDECATVRN